MSLTVHYRFFFSDSSKFSSFRAMCPVCGDWMSVEMGLYVSRLVKIGPSDCGSAVMTLSSLRKKSKCMR
jgi:hypothetical protein